MRVRALTRPTNGGGGTVQLRYVMCVCPALVLALSVDTHYTGSLHWSVWTV